MSGPRILAVLCVRNEGAFLLEWFAHARAVGFTDILAFSNGCDDGTDRMLDRLAEIGLCTHLRNDGQAPQGPQWAALRRAETHPLRAAAEWIMVLDIDEFPNVHIGDHTLGALIAAVPGADALALTWRMFGNAGVVAFEDVAVTETFTRAAPAVLHWPWRAQQIKTLFRNHGAYARLGVHRPRAPDPARLAGLHWADGSGRRLPAAFHAARVFTDPGQDCGRLAQLNHYALGAMESFVVKCDRGRANRQGAPFDMGYWVERNFDAVEDRSIAAIAPRAAPLRADLHADPVLGPLHRAAVAWRRARLAALMAQEEWRAFFGRLMMAPPSRLLSAAQARAIRARGAAREGGAGETMSPEW